MEDDVKTKVESLRVAWIEEINHVVSFHEIPNSRCHAAEETEFWAHIQAIVKSGYAIQ